MHKSVVGFATRIFLLHSALLLSSAIVAADTIVLKNGRRISASQAVDQGDKVTFETSAGELSLPKSVVDHIEKNTAVPMDSAHDAAASLVITQPSRGLSLAGGADEIEHAAVHDGAIDRQYMARLAEAAHSGSREANMSAAIGYHAASLFELARGDINHALADARTALIYAPEEPGLLLDAAYLHLRRSEYKQSLDYLDRARRYAAENADLAKLAGWAYYGMNKIDLAVAEWTRAMSLRPEPEVRAALDKAQRDKREEENYKENESTHFILRYSGTAEPALARDILRTLEMHYLVIESELSFTPPDSIGVILYTRQAFADITRAPAWVSAVNDGRIRVPVQGLTTVSSDLSRVLKHELMHSFIKQKTHGLAPTWIQEGLAQWMEGQRSENNAAMLIQTYHAGHAEPLDKLETSWMRLSNDAAASAYAWSLATIEYIVHANGMSDVQRILDRIALGSTTEDALRQVLHSGYSDVMQSTAEYLRNTYAR